MHTISLGRHRLAHVISSISSSTLHLLLVRPWLELQTALRAATYPGQLVQAHAVYLPHPIVSFEEFVWALGRFIQQSQTDNNNLFES